MMEILLSGMGLGFGFLLILVGGFSWLYGIGTILSCSANATHGNCWDPNNAPESRGASGDVNRVGAEAFYFGLAVFAVGITAITGTLDVVWRIIGDISSNITNGLRKLIESLMRILRRLPRED